MSLRVARRSPTFEVRPRLKTALAWMTLSCAGLTAAAQAPPAPAQAPVAPDHLAATIDTSQAAAPVSKYMYGMFIEHIGSLIYRSLWAEMLDDRKFYYDITSPPPAPTERRGPMRMTPRHWTPVGPASAIAMDKKEPFVGEWSPRITLEGATPHGIEQTGLSVVAGKRYTGRIWLRGTPGAHVQVALVWGEQPGQRQVIELPALGESYRSFPLKFTAGQAGGGGTGSDAAAGSAADASDAMGNATLAVTGKGSGSFHIGTLSLMPADNVDGFRPDTIALLRELHSGLWRLPGGNFIADFSWYNSVGPIDKRPPKFDYAWNAAQPNDVGMDEFMTFCRLIGVDPYITVNANFGDEHSAAQEVEYMNGATSTPMGAWRARNGHPEPYHIKYWDIGNEPYGPWELGRTDLKYYVIKHNLFADAMRQADPSITLLASASMPDETIMEGIAQDMHLPFDKVGICSDQDWTCGFLKHSWGNFDGITEHWYERANSRFDMQRAAEDIRVDGREPGLVPVENMPVLEWVRKPSDRVRLKAEEWEAYQKLYPEMAAHHIFMSNDEYAYSGGQPNLKLALAYAMTFNEMLRHSDFLTITAFTMGISTLDISPTSSALNTTGLLFKLYGQHLGEGSIPVAVTGDSPQPAPTQKIVGDLPRTSAGSATYPLDVFAALSPDRRFLTVSVVNATEKTQPLALKVDGVRLAGAPTLWQMTGSSLDAANQLNKPPQVEVKESHPGAGAALEVAPISVSIYRFPVAAQ